MMTRIASFHNYQAVQNNIQRQEGKIHHNQQQLASGKKLVGAADDPLATHYIQHVNQQDEQVSQYMDAIVLVRNRIEHQEVMIANAEQYADEAKRSVMEMINGALSAEDRNSIARELKEMQSNLLHLANSQDESGNYTFAGTKPKNQPFFMNAEGKVTYNGDMYQRKMKVSGALDIPINDPGDKLFMEIDNPYGHYSGKYDLQSASELLLERAINHNESDQSIYSVTFVALPDGEFGYQLEQDGNVVQAQTYDPAVGVQYQDLTINFKGHITPGDRIELQPQRQFSVFDSFQKAIQYADDSVSDSSATAELHQATEQFSAAFLHLTKARTDMGARLNTLDIQESQHEDFRLSLAKSRSNFEDLDYSKAVIEFNENQLALKASQQAFGKVKDLTLFNYI